MDPNKRVTFAYDTLYPTQIRPLPPPHTYKAYASHRMEQVYNHSGKNAKIVLESNLCGNVHIFALMIVSSHYWSLFHANDRVFSRNEQQKVYIFFLKTV